nr:uncharacterized protein LOC109157187 [Ipomoea batatas]
MVHQLFLHQNPSKTKDVFGISGYSRIFLPFSLIYKVKWVFFFSLALILPGKVREIVFSGERKNEDENKTENLPSRSDTSVVEVLHFDSISSLVRRWRDFRVVMKTINSTAKNFSVSISKSNSTTSTPCGGSPLMEGLCRHHLAMGNLSPPFHEKNSEALERERLKSPISSRN